MIQGVLVSIFSRPFKTARTIDAAAAPGPSMAVITGMIALCIAAFSSLTACVCISASPRVQPRFCNTSVYLPYQ